MKNNFIDNHEKNDIEIWDDVGVLKIKSVLHKYITGQLIENRAELVS